MKKSLFIVAAAAMMTACSNEVLREDYRQDDTQSAITFETFVQKAVNTRAEQSENNGLSTTSGLENFHTNFQVWGYKYNTGIASEEAVFTGKEVSYNSVASSDAKSWNYTSWTYTPVAYWDKSAENYGFYAAAPADTKWIFNNYKFSYAGFSLTGQSLPVTSGDADAKASFNGTSDVDLMISNDITNYNTYKTETPVEFNFNHILARLNISVQAKNLASGDVCYLNEVKVYNMKNQGSFNEASYNANASGDCNRWTTSGSANTTGVGYKSTIASGDALTESPVYYYRGLCIPQEVEYASGDCPLNGKGVSEATKPYLNIKFAINEDKYSYFYNLADLFNGKESEANIKFCEGWMNTLHIIISPEIINFDADVYDWNEKEYQYTLPK